ncbi:MAG TPA: type VI immunity family protein [Anaeromyxobacteraceae bacterium]|nr:type VI immunity family protein [Anaeromyxobacteraceae bacterium]
MPATFDPAELRIADGDGQVVVAPCLSFTVWFRFADPPVFLDFYERAFQALGAEFTYYRAESMKRPAKVTPRARTMVPTWIKKPAELKFYFARFQGGPDLSGPSLEVHYQHWPKLTPAQEDRYRQNLPTLVERGLLSRSGLTTSTFRITVPVDHPLATPDRFAAFALEFRAVKEGEFVTGGCDYGLDVDRTRGELADRPARALCMRYPGLDYWAQSIHQWLHRYDPRAQALLPLVKRAGWITLASERSVEALGGAARLAEALKGDPSVRLLPFAHGLGLRSGEAPRLGDLSRLDIPYRSVAAAIRPVRVDRVGAVGSEDEWMKEWLGLLDREPEAPR